MYGSVVKMTATIKAILVIYRYYLVLLELLLENEETELKIIVSLYT